ncbi:UDP-4-amino-4,6-dideoxy-N-acetyl-beta-L-altrosamine N-acetyltransferase [Psychrobacillus vulpis]|uniref:UDP-4-amino-4, 6-dideoxy-N-acetyl-beta-L-altrosamine N-acetyltransferase n=1 Tax=Psychrobacillus vulpis TaxID=2325572 RepID=A0A544TIX0_9BACI|nr:UDP-4-amino-4,6-dideoxy-N-acetyl-beta-L-altrosamine N-acetyltransferase [Psychrobacillus vulpis]TQR17383.1 UDP-4-amino-4,6-dideoxy-N-acetyl-beta-L-altrosamine N-acetyltransferase [Psychrobacillus vulpis]
MNINKLVKLKDVTENDLPLLFKWRNQEFIREVMYNSGIISWEQHIQWFQGLKNNDNKTTKIFYFDSVPYGVLNITNIDSKNNSCEWGFYIGNSEAPKGMGTILGFTSLNYIFREMKIRKISAEVLDYNIKSIHFHLKLGFTQEGKLREHILRNDTYLDILLYGLFASEWEEKSSNIKTIIEGRLI